MSGRIIVPRRVLYVPHSKQMQGFTPEVQYEALKEAGAKRKRKNHRRAEQIMSGGWKNIPIIRGNS